MPALRRIGEFHRLCLAKARIVPLPLRAGCGKTGRKLTQLPKVFR